MVVYKINEECADTSITTLHNKKNLYGKFSKNDNMMRLINFLNAEKNTNVSLNSSCRLVRFPKSAGRTPLRLRRFS